MLFKTMLLLINIAIIGILACLIVKLYYRDEERKNQANSLDDLENELKTSGHVPAFENSTDKKSDSGFSKTTNRLKERINASKKIIPNQKENDADLEESLNKEIEELTITKQPVKNATDFKPVKAQKTEAAKNKDAVEESAEDSGLKGEPVSINVKNINDDEAIKTEVNDSEEEPSIVEDDEKTTEYGKTVLQTTPTIAKDIDEAKTNISLVDGLKEEKTEPVKTKEVTSEDNEEKKPSYTPDKKKLDEMRRKLANENKADAISNVSREPINKQQENIINKTRNITSETPSNIQGSNMTHNIEAENKAKYEAQVEKQEISKDTNSVGNVKGAFQNIKSAFKNDEELTEYNEPINTAPVRNTENYGSTRDVVLEEILNNHSEEFNHEDTYNDDIVSITPIHDPEEMKKYHESMDYETDNIFDNLDLSTDEITPEEKAFFKSLEEGFNASPILQEEKLSPSQEFHNRHNNKRSKSITHSSGEDEIVITLKGQDHILKRGTSIIFQHQNEKYGSSILAINGDEINVTYRGQKIWIPSSDVTKVF